MEPTLNDIQNFLKCSDNYDFHYKVWSAFFDTYEYDANQVYDMLVNKYDEPNVNYNNMYRSNLTSIPNFSPFLKAVVKYNALDLYFGYIDLEIALKIGDSIIELVKDTDEMEFFFNLEFSQVKRISNYFDWETFFKLDYQNKLLSFNSVDFSDQNVLAQLPNIFSEPYEMDDTTNERIQINFSKVGPYTFWSLVYHGFEFNYSILDMIFEIHPEILLDKLFVDDLKKLIDDNEYTEENMLFHTNNLESRKRVLKIIKYLKKRPHLELMIKLN